MHSGKQRQGFTVTGQGKVLAIAHVARQTMDVVFYHRTIFLQRRARRVDQWCREEEANALLLRQILWHGLGKDGMNFGSTARARLDLQAAAHLPDPFLHSNQCEAPGVCAVVTPGGIESRAVVAQA
jgi:hypothetical protein